MLPRHMVRHACHADHARIRFRGGVGVRNPELACDWCGDEVANGEGVYVDGDRVCSECAAQEVQRHER